MRRHRSRLMLGVAFALACVVALSNVASAAPTPTGHGQSAQSTPAGTQAPPTGPPAPAGFQQQLLDLYGQMTAIAAKYPPPAGSGLTLPTVDAFTQTVGSLTPAQLDQVYDGNPTSWDQVQQALTTLLSNSTANAMKSQPSPNGTKSKPSTPSVMTVPNSLQPNDVTVPLPPVPTIRSCATEQTFENLHAASFALQATSYGLQVAQDALSIALAFAPRDIVLVVAGEGGTVDADPVWSVLEDVVLGLSIAQHAVDFAQNTVDYNATQINDCFGDGGATELQFVFDTIQALGTIGNQSLTNEANISAAIDTGFAQTYQKLANLQTSVNTAQASLDLALKQRIESALLGAATSPLTDFELPNSAGGYLDATPIGVKVVVTDALAAMKATGQSVVSTAPRLLTLANGYLASGSYKKAFAEYQLAYQAIAQP